jgi:hypothetical protein
MVSTDCADRIKYTTRLRNGVTVNVPHHMTPYINVNVTIPFKVCGFDGCAVKRHLVVTGNLLNYQLDIFRYNKNIFLNLDNGVTVNVPHHMTP